MYKAALARKLNFLVNSFGGDPFGLSQVCADRTHYVGALFLEPEKWGESAVATIMRMANQMPYSLEHRHRRHRSDRDEPDRELQVDETFRGWCAGAAPAHQARSSRCRVGRVRVIVRRGEARRG